MNKLVEQNLTRFPVFLKEDYKGPFVNRLLANYLKYYYHFLNVG